MSDLLKALRDAQSAYCVSKARTNLGLCDDVEADRLHFKALDASERVTAILRANGIHPNVLAEMLL